MNIVAMLMQVLTKNNPSENSHEPPVVEGELLLGMEEHTVNNDDVNEAILLYLHMPLSMEAIARLYARFGEEYGQELRSHIYAMGQEIEVLNAEISVQYPREKRLEILFGIFSELYPYIIPEAKARLKASARYAWWRN